MPTSSVSRKLPVANGEATVPDACTPVPVVPVVVLLLRGHEVLGVALHGALVRIQLGLTEVHLRDADEDRDHNHHGDQLDQCEAAPDRRAARRGRPAS